MLILAADMWTQNYTKNSVSEITNELNLLDDSIKKEEYEKIGEQSHRTIEEWNEKYEVLSFYIEHNELEKVKTEFASLQSNLETKQYEEASADINRAKFILEHIRQKMALEVKNIF